MNDPIDTNTMRSLIEAANLVSEATRGVAATRAATNRQDITEASKSQIEALEKAVEQATKNKNKTYAVYFEALKAVEELASAAEAADKVTQDAIKALAAAKAENSRVVHFGRSRFG